MARQRGAIVKRYNRYSLKYRTPDGKQKWESSFATKAEAQARLNELLQEIDKGTYVEPKTITFAEFAEQWIQSRSSIRGSTLSAYASIVKQRLGPYFGKMQLTDIGYAQVQKFVNELRKDVSAKTVHNTLILLRVMLTGKKGASAIKRGFLRSDPTKGVELPPRHPRKIQPLAVETVWKLIDAAEELGGVGRSLVFVDAFTGLRRNEILALGFTDIDWRNRELLVRRAVSKKLSDDGVRKWLWGMGPPKSQKSFRRVALAESVLELIETMRGEAEDRDGLIFRRPDGSAIDPDYFDAWIFAPILEKAGLKIRFHDLRHFFASMLIAQGESPKYVCDQMGHSSIQVTFDIYGHLFPQSRREAADKLQQAMLEGKIKANGSSLVAGQNKSDRFRLPDRKRKITGDD
jgi:integrase